MSSRNQKVTKVIEQEGEVDEDQEDQESTQKDVQPSQNNTVQSSQQNSNRNENDKSTVKGQIVYKEKMFDDIIGLKTYFEEYKNKDINEITSRIEELKIAQENNQSSIKEVRDNITEEEKIKQIRQAFGQAHLYILKLKGLKNRMQKIDNKLTAAKTKLLTQNTSQNKK